MDAERQARIGRLKWHCRRALLELDIMFDHFWLECGDNLEAADEAALTRLLALEDHELWGIVSGREANGDPQLAGIIERLRSAQAAARLS